MKNRVFKKICFVLVLGVMLTTAACSSYTQNKNSVGIQGEENVVSPTPEIKNLEDLKKDVVTPAIELAATKELSIYTLNWDSIEVESRVALVSQDTELTPELVVELVTDSLADGMYNVEIDEVTTQNDAVIVSFMPDSLPVTGMDKDTETAILDVIAQSLVDNFMEEYPKVVFRIGGKAYSTDQYSFGLNDVYLDGTKTN